MLYGVHFNLLASLELIGVSRWLLKCGFIFIRSNGDIYLHLSRSTRPHPS